MDRPIALGVYFSNHCFRSPVATSRASEADSGCCRHHLGLTSLTFFLCISKVETEPRTLWALVELGERCTPSFIHGCRSASLTFCLGLTFPEARVSRAVVLLRGKIRMNAMGRERAIPQLSASEGQCQHPCASVLGAGIEGSFF